MKWLGSIVFFSCVFFLDALKYDNSKSDVLPSLNECGQQHSDSSEKGANVYEFPWIVYIPLGTRTPNPDAHVRCAGALISKRYVLINKSSLQFVLTKVYLGQYDTSKNDTCDGSKCAPVVEVDIEKRIVNENFDIVILRLARDVEFTDLIQPLCLPFDEFKRAEAGNTVYSSGWGLKSNDVQFSLTKKEVKETLVSQKSCSNGPEGGKTSGQICVKVQDDSSSIPCNGDEGSPIMYLTDKKQWIVEGILTGLFDSINEPCSVKSPARGAKITEEILEWILKNISP